MESGSLTNIYGELKISFSTRSMLMLMLVLVLLLLIGRSRVGSSPTPTDSLSKILNIKHQMMLYGSSSVFYTYVVLCIWAHLVSSIPVSTTYTSTDQHQQYDNFDETTATRIPSFQARGGLGNFGNAFKKVGSAVKSVNWKSVGNTIKSQATGFVKSQITAVKAVAASAKTFGTGFASGGAGVVSALKHGDIKGAMKQAGTAMKNNAMNGLKLATGVAAFVSLWIYFVSLSI